MPTMGLFRRMLPVDPKNRAVAEAEDAAVGGDQPVAGAVGRRRHADDRLVQVLAAHGAEEAGVAEAEDAAVGGHQPVPVRARRHGHADHGLVETDAAGAAPEAGVAEVEDAAVGGHEAVAVAAVEVAAEAVVVGRGRRRDALRVGHGDVDAEGVRGVGRDDRDGGLASAATIRPAPADPNVTEVALAKPPPMIVMAPPPATGPVFGLTAATDGHPSAPCRAMDRSWSTGVPSPLAGS